MIKKIFSSTLFWISFAVLSIISVVGTFYFFPRAFPIVHLQIKMDREQALLQAKKISAQLHLGPSDYRQALQFTTDTVTKTFVEIDAGGVPAFTAMMEQNLYQPYVWQVRHFKEFDAHELIIRFTPEGAPYGFVETMAENEPGARLTPAQAQLIAEKDAQTRWAINLSQFHQIENSREVRHGGRIDHAFVYERNEATIGAGRYRLRLVVSGDKLTEVTHSVKVPEQFILRYKEMRSSNDSLASAATMFMLVLYIIGGCILGLIFLLRSRWIVWKMALLWGCFIALLNLFSGFNELPLLWMTYDTALASQGFLINYVIELVLQFFIHAASMTLFFMAAESLTRKAFGNQLQLFKTWSTQTASSYQVVGQTLAAYLLVPFDFLFLVIFYLLTRTLFGWWVPADEIVNPNIVATYFPWISSIAQSLMAGFQEECLFRAVPLASAALIGQRLGKRNLCIGIAFILQAFIFGAAHANYAAQPCYARMIELLVPSWIFGALYLAFGLLPGIIMHFIIDVVWFALPIFVSCGLHAYLNQACVIAAALVPILVIVYSRMRTGRFHEASEPNYNRAWQPSQKIEAESPKSEVVTTLINLTSRYVMLLIGISIVSTVFFIYFAPWHQDGTPLRISRAQAIAQAKKHISAMNDISSFTPLASLQATIDQNPEEYVHQRYIWQLPKIGQKSSYDYFVRNYYVSPPHWLIRLVKFNGTLDDRAEEFQVKIADNGTIFQQAHKIAESIAMSSLNQQEATALVLKSIKESYGYDQNNLEEITATPIKHPERTDWSFTFDYGHAQRIMRINAEIVGNQLSSLSRTVHVPESWQRNERHHFNTIKIVSTMSMFILFALLMFGLILLLRSLHSVNIRISLLLSSFFLLFFLGNIFNNYSEMIAQFNTVQPFSHQLFSSLGMIIIFACVKATCFGFLVAATLRSKSQYIISSLRSSIISAMAAGLFMSGMSALIFYFEPSLKPTWADFSALAGTLPLFSSVSSYVGKLITMSFVFLLVAITINFLQERRHIIFSLFYSLIAGMLLFPSLDSLLFWLIGGLILGISLWITYQYLLHRDLTLIPLACAVFLGIEIIKQAWYQAYPGVLWQLAIAFLVVTLIAYIWFRGMRRTSNLEK